MLTGICPSLRPPALDGEFRVVDTGSAAAPPGHTWAVEYTADSVIVKVVPGVTSTSKFLACFRADGSARPLFTGWSPKVNANPFGDGFGMEADSNHSESDPSKEVVDPCNRLLRRCPSRVRHPHRDAPSTVDTTREPAKMPEMTPLDRTASTRSALYPHGPSVGAEMAESESLSARNLGSQTHRALARAAALAALLTLAGATLGGDAEGRLNLAEKSPLPTGLGLAAAFPGDRGIKTHEQVIFADDFEAGPLGAGWDEVGNKNGKVLSLVAPPGDGGLGKRCLRVEAHLKEDTGGGLTKWFEPADTVFIRFYTWFDPGCDYVHHFVTLRANQGLQGGEKWSGFGGAGLKPEGNERFSTAIEPWGDWGRWPAPGRWNFYSYWHEMEVSRDGKYWGNSFGVPSAPVIPRDRWICVEFMLRQNTPGQPDGEQAFWIDGKLQGHWQGFNWRKTAQLKANALTLETYITDRWTKNPVNVVCFDNVVIARRYIGPSPQG